MPSIALYKILSVNIIVIVVFYSRYCSYFLSQMKKAKTVLFYLYRAFSHDVTAAILVFQNNETAAILVFQTNPLGVRLFSNVKFFFCPHKFA